jgi:hypothetical protein
MRDRVPVARYSIPIGFVNAEGRPIGWQPVFSERTVSYHLWCGSSSPFCRTENYWLYGQDDGASNCRVVVQILQCDSAMGKLQLPNTLKLLCLSQ